MNPFAKFAVVLCIVMQAWLGCAGGGGKTLCLSLCAEACSGRGEAELAVSGDESCRHEHGDHHEHGPLPMSVPSHDHDGDCCIDIPLPDMIGAQQVDPIKPFEHFVAIAVAWDLHAAWGGIDHFADARWAWRGPPDAARMHESMGLPTTRLRL